MSCMFDRATEREEQLREDALAEHRRRAEERAALTVADSATHCHVCEQLIPQERRAAVPGVKTCIECATDLERALR